MTPEEFWKGTLKLKNTGLEKTYDLYIAELRQELIVIFEPYKDVIHIDKDKEDILYLKSLDFSRFRTILKIDYPNVWGESKVYMYEAEQFTINFLKSKPLIKHFISTILNGLSVHYNTALIKTAYYRYSQEVLEKPLPKPSISFVDLLEDTYRNYSV